MEKLLPQNLEAERGVLGSIIIDPEAPDRVVGFLQASDFYRDAHRTIYEAVLTLAGQGQSADFITICDELERCNKLEDVGGASYITSLINQVPTSGNVEYYGRIVERTSVLRHLISAAGRIAAVAYDEVEVSVALEQAEREIFEISARYLLAQSSDIGMGELMAQYLQLLDARFENRGRIVGVQTGFTDLDRLLGGLQRSDLDILAARTSIGKTALAVNIAYNAAIKFKRNVGIFSLEMSKEQLAQRFVALDSNVEQQKLRTGRIEDDDWPALIATVGHLAELGIRIDDTSGISLMQMRSRARRWIAEYGIELIIVDYLQLMTTGDNRKYENRQVEVAAISRGLKNLARELHIPVLALAQLSRALESRQSKVPQLSDLRESGGIENDADVVMFIYRDEVYNPETERKNQADIIVAKHRNGPVGEVVLYFNQAQSRFGNLDIALLDNGEELVFAAEDEVQSEGEKGFPPDEDGEGWEEETDQDEE
jgi:replicative DNA helicase